MALSGLSNPSLGGTVVQRYGTDSATRLETFSRLYMGAGTQSSANVTTANALIAGVCSTFFTPDKNLTATSAFLVSASTATTVFACTFALAVFSVAANDGSNDGLTGILGRYECGLGITNQGTAYVNADALTQTATSGVGTGFTATVTTSAAGLIQTLQITAGGTGYAVGDTITLSNAHAGTNAIIRVLSVTAGAVLAQPTTGNADDALHTVNKSYGGALNTPVSFVAGTRYGASFIFNGSGTPSVYALQPNTTAFAGLLRPALGRKAGQYAHLNGMPTSGFTIAEHLSSTTVPYIYFT